MLGLAASSPMLYRHHDGEQTVVALRAELAEAKRIGTWLYAHLPAGARHPPR